MKTLSRVEVKDDINKNRNHCWLKEIYERHKDELDREILYYFGKNITYKELFDESIALAKALKANGIGKGDEFVVCIDRIPEFVYFMAAASIVGAKVNFVSEKFDDTYLKSIIKKANCKTIFIQDYKVKKLSKLVNELDGYNVVTISHKRSLPKKNEYEEIFNRFYNFEVSDYRCTDYDEFVASGKDYTGKVFEISTLDDPLTVTYSSGTTKQGFPKGIVHKNRHYITMGRYHDPEVSGLPSLKKYSTYSNIPVYSNSFVLSALSDNLILGGKVILDPIDNPDYFLIAMKIHKSNVNIATPSMWITNAINYLRDDKYNIKELPDALFNFAGGEQLSAGEEKTVNRCFKKLKCGINVTHTPVSVSKISMAGADCEHGSVFLKLFRAYFNNQPYRIGRKEPIGMAPYDFVDVKVLRKDGTYCDTLEHGRLVANSDCTMLEYNHNPEETNEFYITDAYGKVWGDMKNYGFVDEKGNVSMKGRYNDDDIIPCYRIADEILKDTKKIMSCEVVKIKDGDKYVYVAHIVPQYGTTFNKEKVLNGAIQRCINAFGSSITRDLYFRIHYLDDIFKMASSGKRNVKLLEDEGLEKVENLNYNINKTKIKKKYKHN